MKGKASFRKMYLLIQSFLRSAFHVHILPFRVLLGLSFFHFFCSRVFAQILRFHSIRKALPSSCIMSGLVGSSLQTNRAWPVNSDVSDMTRDVTHTFSIIFLLPKKPQVDNLCLACLYCQVLKNRLNLIDKSKLYFQSCTVVLYS